MIYSLFRACGLPCTELRLSIDDHEGHAEAEESDAVVVNMGF